MSLELRSRDALRRHYEAERELADRLRQSTREQRIDLYRTLYDELFARVPDHPRLVRREDPEALRTAVAARLKLVEPFLEPGATFVEFAPGDCGLAFAVCPRVKTVIGIDISDQAGEGREAPENFQSIVYDGYRLDLPADSADIVFSYQMLEHLHPDDMDLHLQLVRRILKPGGVYVFSTPHRFSGPHDVSRHFSSVPQGFHLKEWTYGEFVARLRALGYSSWWTYRLGRQWPSPWATRLTLVGETMVGWLPHGLRRRLSARLFESIFIVARK